VTSYSALSAHPIACDAIIEGRAMDAVLVLTESMPLDRAIGLLGPDRAPRVGDILVRTWGYDQTNVDFYQVLAVTARSVRIRPILGRVCPPALRVAMSGVTLKVNGAPVSGLASERGCSEVVMPVPGGFKISTDPDDRPSTRRFTLARDRIRGSYYRAKVTDSDSAVLWDGSPQSQTAAGFGH
jgi:hypothetical protein